MMSLNEMCFDKIILTIKESSPKNLQDCDTIFNYVNQLPPLLIKTLEKFAAETYAIYHYPIDN